MKKKKVSLSLKLIYLLLITSLVIGISMARYKTTSNGNVDIKTADWIFKINSADPTMQTETAVINLAESIGSSENFDYEKKILVPGVSGDFDIAIDFTDVEVGIDYDITFSVPQDSNVPRNIFFYRIDESNNKIDVLTQSINNTFTFEQIENNPVVTYKIYWIWEFSKSTNESEYEGSNFSINATVNVRQHIA